MFIACLSGDDVHGIEDDKIKPLSIENGDVQFFDTFELTVNEGGNFVINAINILDSKGRNSALNEYNSIDINKLVECMEQCKQVVFTKK